MHRTRQHIVVACALIFGAPLTLWAGEPEQAQMRSLQAQNAQAAPEFAQNVVMPQSRVFSVERLGLPVAIADVHANIHIGDKTASTTMDVQLRNPLRQPQRAQVLLAVPEGAVLRGFSLPESGQECTAQIVSAKDSRSLIEALAARTRDAACIEFAGYDLVRSGSFTVEGLREQRVQLLYDSPLVAQPGRLDYCLPRSELLENAAPWRINVQVESHAPVSTAYSPSHALQMKRESANSILVGVPGGSTNEPGPFRLSVLPGSDGLAATLYTYPDVTVGGGFFLFLAGLPAHPPKVAADVTFPKREVTLVFDQSGSMNDGNHLDQLRSAGKKILDQLQPGEWFNIITFNDRAQAFAEGPVTKNVENTIAAGRFLAAMDARGGTNIYDALAKALRQRLPADNLLPIVMFVTDGVPTTGQTSETIIRNLARDGNPSHRRIYTFGIGVEVNVPLLQNLASSTRGRAAFVMARQNVEQKLIETFTGLARPTFTDPQIDLAAGAEPKDKLESAASQMPELLPDIFEDGQLTVVGRYAGQGPLQFRLSGNYLGKAAAFDYGFPAAAQALVGGNAFVPRLWAGRRIGRLVDQVRQLGADGGTPPLTQLAEVGVAAVAATPAAPPLDVRGPARELARLSRENGVLTEYTFFLASDRTELTDEEKVVTGVESRLQKRAVEDRYGNEAVNQDMNIVAQRDQATLNISNRMMDAELRPITVRAVQQVADRTLFRRSGRWLDSRLLPREKTLKADQVVEFGTAEYEHMLDRFVSEGRQGCLALRGDILMDVDGRVVQFKSLAAAAAK